MGLQNLLDICELMLVAKDLVDKKKSIFVFEASKINFEKLNEKSSLRCSE